MRGAGGAPAAPSRAVLLAMAAILFIPPLFTRTPWSPDEPKYAESAREMVSSGDFALPRLNGSVYSEKPPLYLWLSAAASAIPGVPKGSGGRLVSAAASAATLLMTSSLAILVAGESAGPIAAVILASMLLFWDLSQTGVIDPALTAAVTAALLGFARHRAGRKGGILLFYAACSAGVLLKGPVGFVLPALAALALVLLEDGPRGLRAAHPLWGVPLVAAPVLVWLWLASARAGAGYAETMLVRQNVGRAFDAFIHRKPAWFFLPILPLALLPWTALLPPALAAGWRERAGRARPLLLPLAWFVTTLVFFSAVSGKKTRYLMPLLPAAAILAAAYLTRRALDRNGSIRAGRWAIAATAAVGIAVAAALAAPALAGPSILGGRVAAMLAEPGSEAARGAIEDLLGGRSAWRLLAPALVLGAASLWSLRLALRRRGEALAAAACGWLAVQAWGGIFWLPPLEEIKGASALAREISAAAGELPLHYYRSTFAGVLNLHLERDRLPVLNRAGDVREALARGPAAIVGERGDLERLREGGVPVGPPGPCRRVGEDTLCLVFGAGSPAQRPGG